RLPRVLDEWLLKQRQLVRRRAVGRGAVGLAYRGRIRRGDLLRHVVRQRLEVRRAGDEVRLAVDLDDHADLARMVDVRLDDSLARLTSGALRYLGKPLFAEERPGL